MAPHLLSASEVVVTLSKPAALTRKPLPADSMPISTPIPTEDHHNDVPPKRNWLMGEQAYKASMPHHAGIRALWETKWKFPCTKSVYPFHDGSYEDFAPIFEHLIAHDINDGTSPEYTRAFFPVAGELEAAGDVAASRRDEEQGQAEKASELYLRAACVLRIARFPYISAHVSPEQDPTKWKAWEWQKKVYMKAAGEGKVWDRVGLAPVVEVDIPHVFAKEGDLGRTIPAYLRMPRIPGQVAGHGDGDAARSGADSGPTRSTASAVKSGSATLSTGLWTLEVKEEKQQPLKNIQQQQQQHRNRDTTNTFKPSISSSSSASSRSSTPTPSQHQDWPSTTKHPVVILLTGLDGYRPDNTVRCNEFLSRGWSCLVLEIPGTADCPADPSDPEASERLWDSIFAWMKDYSYSYNSHAAAAAPYHDQREQAQRFDLSRVLVWGLSAGGYHAVRMAHTHASRLAGVVAQGAGVHYFFDREWIEHAEGHEYPFALAPAMAMKHGYESVAAYKDQVQKQWSLLENGILGRQSARLLLVNGTQDGLMPIEDSMLLFEHGSPKEARFFAGALHMGYPLANSAVYPWMEQVLAGVVDRA